MGTFFWLFSHVSGYLTVLVLALALSSGLYMLSMLAEEFPSLMGKCLKSLLGVLVVVQLLLWADGLPHFECVVELGALASYALLLRTFPVVTIISFEVAFGLVGFFATNIYWLRYFLQNKSDTLSVLGFFVVLVWSLPCGLVASLTVEDQALPFAQSNDQEKRKSSFRAILDAIYEHTDKLFSGNVSGLVDAFRKRSN